VAELVGDLEVSRWTSNIPHPYSEQDAFDWITSTGQDDSKHSFAVELDGQLVACVSYWPHGSGGVEIGYWVGKVYWGKGVCSNALKLLLESGAIPSQSDIHARTMAGNTRSQRVLEKCGFEALESGTARREEDELKARFFVRRAVI